MCYGMVLRTSINSLNVNVEQLARGMVLFTLASGTVLYQFGPPLLCGTVSHGTVLLRTGSMSVYAGK